MKRKNREKGLNYVWGGKFHHMLGDNDKGKAVGILKELYSKEGISTFTVPIGDSMNDAPMLLAVDHPIFLRDEDRLLPETLASIRNWTVINGIGPRTWNEAILSIIGQESDRESCS